MKRFWDTATIREEPQGFLILLDARPMHLPGGGLLRATTRTLAEALAADYERHIPYYAFRHAVKPGITGWAAVRQGNVAEVEAATAKLRHDFFYIKNVSPSLDAFIAMKTTWIILTGFGSR